MNTASRLSNLDLGNDVSDTPVAPLSQPAPPPVKEIPGVTVDQDGVRRAMADEAAARSAGFALKPPIYEIGTLVVQAGVDNFKKSRSAFEKLPSVPEACKKLMGVVQAEERMDVKVDVPNLHMNDDGTLNTRGNGTYPTSLQAIYGLARHSVPMEAGGANYLAECPAWLRAKNFNYWFENGYRVDGRGTKKAVAGAKGLKSSRDVAIDEVDPNALLYKAKGLTVRTRKNGNGREAWAVTGPAYTAVDIDQISQQIMDSVGGDARCNITYDGYKARFDVQFHSDINASKAVAGEIFKAGIIVRTADDGSGSVNVSTSLTRNLCLNLIILDHAKILVGRRRHVGKDASIKQKIDECLAQSQEILGHFIKAWDSATQDDILKRYDLSSPDEVFKGMVLNKMVQAPGVKNDELIARLRRAWDKEPGHTKSAFLNAITRMHEEGWRNWQTLDELESTAGALLFEKDWSFVVPPKDKTLAEVLGG